MEKTVKELKKIIKDKEAHIKSLWKAVQKETEINIKQKLKHREEIIRIVNIYQEHAEKLERELKEFTQISNENRRKDKKNN